MNLVSWCNFVRVELQSLLHWLYCFHVYSTIGCEGMFFVLAPRFSIQWIIQHWMSDPHSHRRFLIITRVWPECGRCPSLIYLIEWNLSVRRRGSLNYHIFVMYWVDSNHLTVSDRPNHSPTKLMKMTRISNNLDW